MKQTLIEIFLFVSAVATAGQLNVQLENDFPFHDDADYTHGTRFEYVRENGMRYGAQQQMYTPLDLRNADQIEGRHPYAGYLVGFVGYRDPDYRGSYTLYDDCELQIGVLGPSSGAEETQKLIHKVLGCKYPAGWDHQLHDEFVFQTVYWKGLDVRLAGRDFGWSLHWESEVGGMLGTLQIAPGVNTAIKAGYGFGPAEPDNEMRVRGVEKPVGAVYALVGCEGRYWARNELLDGNAGYVRNHDTLTVDKEDWTGCIKAGFGVRYRQFDARLLWMWWSREYKTQESVPHYISLTIGMGF